MGKLIPTLLALGCISLFLTAAHQNGKGLSGETSLSDADQKAIVLAIEDEIYDWGCQKEYEFVGAGRGGNGHEIRVYINPKLSDGRGEIIYKFMPFGEMFRSFSLDKNGMVSLDDTPTARFWPGAPELQDGVYG